MTTAALRICLPVVFCPDCRSQLVNYLYVDEADALLCCHCAKRRPPGSVGPLQAGYEGLVDHAQDPLDQDDAVELLIAAGGTVVPT